MSVENYVEALREYNQKKAAFGKLSAAILECLTLLGRYGNPVQDHGGALVYKPESRTVGGSLNPDTWPTAHDIQSAMQAVDEAGKAVVEAYNKLGRDDRVLVIAPK